MINLSGSPELDRIVKDLEKLRWHDDFGALENAISQLNEHHRTRVEIVQQLARYCFEIGDFHRAARYVQHANFDNLTVQEAALCSEDAAYLALLSARIETKRNIAFQAGLNLSRIIDKSHGQLLGLDLRLPSFDGLAIREFDQSGSQDWPESHIESLVSKSEGLTDLWFLIEAQLLAIHFDAMDNGYLYVDETWRTLATRIRVVRRILRHRSGDRANRLEVEFILNNPHDPLLGSLEDQLDVYSDLRGRLQEDTIEYTKVSQRYSVVLYAKDPHSAELGLQACLDYYEKRGNKVGELSVDFAILNNSQSCANDLQSYRIIADKSRSIQYEPLFWDSLSKAVLATCNTQPAQFFEIAKQLSVSLDLRGNNKELLELQICRCSCLAFAPPRRKEDLENSIRSLEQLLNNEKVTPTNVFAAYNVLQDCHRTLGRSDQAVAIAELWFDCDYAERFYRKRCEALQQLALNRHLQVTRSLRKNFRFENERRKALDNEFLRISTYIQELQHFAALDLKRGYQDLRQQKAIRLILYYNSIILHYQERRQEAVDGRREWLRVATQGPLKNDLTALTAMISHLSNREADAGIAEVDQMSQAHSDANIQFLKARARRTWFDEHRISLNHDEQVKKLEEILFFLRRSHEILRDHNKLNPQFVQATRQWTDTIHDLVQAQPERKVGFMKELEQFLSRAENSMENLRASYPEQRDTGKFLQSREDEAEVFRRELFESAATFYLRMDQPREALLWNEKGRGRAMIAALNRSSYLAVELLDQPGTLSNQSTSKVPFGKARSNLEIYSSSSEPERRLQEQTPKISSIWSSVVDELFNFRKFLRSGKVVIVDGHISLQGALTMLTSNSETKIVQAQPLLVKADTIKKWIQYYLYHPHKELEHNGGALKDLKGIISGLEHVSQEGDLLILTPVFPLSLLPIHGLVVDEMNPKRLLSRNPVVYNTSLSLATQCFRSSTEAFRSLHTLSQAAFTAVYDDGNENKAKERELIYASTENTAGQLGSAEVVTGRNVTKTEFQNLLQTSPWVHYHGHVDPGSKPLDQSFILGSGSSTSPQQHDNTGDVFTVADIICLDLHQHRPFVCSIACESAIQDVGLGNEPLGIMSALFIAGAATALGTLWTVHSRAGREFSRLFYEDIKKQIDDPIIVDEHCWINLATATQTAVCEMMRQTERKEGLWLKNLNHWGAFVLHGSPFFKYR